MDCVILVEDRALIYEHISTTYDVYFTCSGSFTSTAQRQIIELSSSSKFQKQLFYSLSISPRTPNWTPHNNLIFNGVNWLMVCFIKVISASQSPTQISYYSIFLMVKHLLGYK